MRKFGMVRVASASFDVRVAKPMTNAAKIIELAKEADSKDVDIVGYQELALTGYTCADLFLQSTLKKETEEALRYVRDNSKGIDVLMVVGLPIYTDGMLFNTAAFIYDGKIIGIVPKTYIPNYSEFYEKRWFAPGGLRLSDEVIIDGEAIPFTPNIIVEMNNGARVAAEVCEDLWVNSAPSDRHTMYGANIVFNPSASDAVISKKQYRLELVKNQSARCMCGYVYVSAGAGESSTDLVFDGHCIIADNGKIVSADQIREEKLMIAVIDIEKIENDRVKYNSMIYDRPEAKYIKLCVNTSKDKVVLPETMNAYPFVPSAKNDRMARCEEILGIQAMGLAERIKKIGHPKAVIGISGGLDSTLALIVVKKAFELTGDEAKKIIAITMPGFGTTGRTKNNSTTLMELLGVDSREINIKDACIQHMKDIGHPLDQFDVTYENVQARERTQILMDVANKEGGIVIGTGDLSELALGWCTYNGDHMSMYGVNGSVPKTLVRYIIESFALSYTDEDKEKEEGIRKVLLDICDTPISPELLPTDENGEMVQKTENTIGKYDLHDFFLYHMLRNGFDREKIEALAKIAFMGRCSDEEVENTLDTFMRRFYSQQFKRSCLPDGPKVGTVCISPRGDWRMPSDIY